MLIKILSQKGKKQHEREERTRKKLRFDKKLSEKTNNNRQEKTRTKNRKKQGK